MGNRTNEFWLVAFFLSKFGNTIPGKETAPPFELKTKKWKEAYGKFYKTLGKGKTTRSFENSLKNCRDTFDGHIKNSNRKGWRDLDRSPVKLPPLAKSIFNKYNTISRESIWKEICKMISLEITNIEYTMPHLIDKKRPENSKNLVIKKKIKNPDWTREEMILALDLYFRLDQGQMHHRNPDVIRVSNELIALNIHTEISDKKKFRSPDSVSRRLGNFKTMDKTYLGEGLPNAGKLARKVWDEFKSHRDKLSKEAELIRQLYLKPGSDEDSGFSEKEYNYKTDFLFNYHRNKETDPVVVKVKKEMVLSEKKSLKCEVCGIDSLDFYGELGKDMMEIHYEKELKDVPGLETIEMKDCIIVCSNCHKILDKNYGLFTSSDLFRIIKKK
jgi:5-methylcytosine-specific restriction enzyme A